jgi:hypothetical protein
MLEKTSDYVLHNPGGHSAIPSPEENPYCHMDPADVRGMLIKENNPEERKKMISAIKQFERQCGDYGDHPWIRNKFKCGSVIRKYRALRAELTPAPENMEYYNDSEQNQGFDEIIDSLSGLYDNNNEVRFDYSREGERPIRDIDTSYGDFLSPKDGPLNLSDAPGTKIVRERGDAQTDVPPDMIPDWEQGGLIDYYDNSDHF